MRDKVFDYADNGYTISELIDHDYWNKHGMITGVNRGGSGRRKPRVAHLYQGNFSGPKDPLCHHGWTRGGPEEGYSIFRNNIGTEGICRLCIRNARKVILAKKEE